MTELSASVLFVCLGNICRSPTAEAVCRHKAAHRGIEVYIDSAGTIGHHVGSPPDPRSKVVGEGRGYDFEGIACRKVTDDDFHQFSYIVAMDEENLTALKEKCPPAMRNKLYLMMDFAQTEVSERVVPDPYYGGNKGFEYVLDLIETAVDGLLDHVEKNLLNVRAS